MEKVNPQHWTLDQCAEKLRESEKSEEITEMIFDLRGTVFFKLKELGKFAEDVDGSDAQVLVDMVIGRLMGAL